MTLAFALLGIGSSAVAQAATINWKGHTWQVTSGGMAGVCQGDPKNVTVDGDGFLHVRIANSGGTWTSSELFTTDRLNFGTYQWQVDGPIDTLDKNVVLGLFPYGPAANIGSDKTNEIDIEYSRWGQADGPNGDWTNYPASGPTIGELSYTFSLGGMTLSTSRFTWSSSSITDALLTGLQPVDGSTGLIKTWTYAPSTPSVNIAQQALPLGMNLWCFDAPPSDSRPVEIVIRDFVFVPAGAGGAGGVGGKAGNAGGTSGAGGGGGVAGRPPGSGGVGGPPAGSGGVGGRPAGSGGVGGRPAGSGGVGGPALGSGGSIGVPLGNGGSGGSAAASGGAGGRSGGTGGDVGVPPAGTGGAGDSGPGSGGAGNAGGSSSGGCSCDAGTQGDAASWPALALITAVLAAAYRRRRGSSKFQGA